MKFRLQEYEGSRFVTADVSLSDDVLVLTYDLASPGCSPEKVKWPAPTASPGRRDELWRHTCLELFVGSPGNKGYAELNLSPTGDWACYAFSDYREAMQPSDAMVVTDIQFDADKSLIKATVTMKIGSDPLLLGPAAIVEDLEGRLTYFAVQHPANPDFHRQDFYIQTARNHL